MDNAQLERLAVARLTGAGGAAREDGRWEFKSAWISDHGKAARRIAAHCNASAGEPALWAFGVGDDGRPVGCTPVEPADWWAQVRRHFDGAAPALLAHAETELAGVPVSLLAFDSSLAPYVWKADSAGERGAVTREVPWREATGVRSAGRAEILRLLHAHEAAPEVEVVDADLRLAPSTVSPGRWAWSGCVSTYITPRTAEAVVIPWHRCRLVVSIPGGDARFEAPIHPLTANVPLPAHPASLVHETPTEAIVRGPGSLVVWFDALTPSFTQPAATLRASLTLGFARAGRQWMAHLDLASRNPGATAPPFQWRLSSLDATSLVAG